MYFFVVKLFFYKIDVNKLIQLKLFSLDVSEKTELIEVMFSFEKQCAIVIMGRGEMKHGVLIDAVRLFSLNDNYAMAFLSGAAR